MTAYAFVRFRVKPGRGKEFEERFGPIDRTMQGFRREAEPATQAP